jgi:hypothetical protein
VVTAAAERSATSIVPLTSSARKAGTRLRRSCSSSQLATSPAVQFECSAASLHPSAASRADAAERSEGTAELTLCDSATSSAVPCADAGNAGTCGGNSDSRCCATTGSFFSSAHRSNAPSPCPLSGQLSNNAANDTKLSVRLP